MYETFCSLRSNDRIKVSLIDSMFGKRDKTLIVGRRTHSKKYNVEKLTLYQINKDGSPCKHSCKFYFYYRPDSDLLSLAMGDMGCSLKGIEVLSTV